jgi:Fe(3+) dicitrate transport protein
MDSDVRAFIPGVGAHYQLNHNSGLFAGVHRGFAPPGPGADDRTDPEESVNYELGYRRNDGRFDLQVVGFYNDYDNLLGSDTLSSGGSGSGDQFNGGAARVGGIEFGAGYRLAPAAATYEIPFTLAYTFTRGEFETSFATDFAGWGSEVNGGDELPYLSPHTAALGVGWIRNRWSVFGNFSYADRMRTQPGQGAISEAESTDAYLLLDLTLTRELRPGFGLHVQLRNATDEVYVAASRPAGVRPGLPRTMIVGVSWDF